MGPSESRRREASGSRHAQGIGQPRPLEPGVLRNLRVLLVAQMELYIRGHQQGAPRSEIETQLSTSERRCPEHVP